MVYIEKLSNKFGYHVAVALGVLLILYLIQLRNYLLFHSLVEIFSILVAFALFIVVWNARGELDNVFLGILGIAYLFVGGLDLLHTLAYDGMGVFVDQGANLPTQLWIFTRYLESISLVGAAVVSYVAARSSKPAISWNKRNLSVLISAYSLIVLLGLISIYSIEIFPQAYVTGEGLTQFKVMSEFLIIGLLVVSIAIISTQRDSFDSRVFLFLTVAILLTAFAELAFTFYIDVYGFSNAVGHFLKLGSFYFMYLAVVKTAITDPQKTLYRSLSNREQELRQYRQTVESSIDLHAAVDSNHQFLFANSRYCDYHDVDQDEIQGKSLDEVIGEDAYQQVVDKVRMGLRGKESRIEISRHTPTKGKRILEALLFPIFDGTGDIRGVGASMRDITLQKEQQRRQETLISHLPGIVYRCRNSPSWPMEMVRGRSKELTGYSSEEIQRGDISWGDDIIYEADREHVWNAVRDATAAGQSFEVKYRIITRSGEQKWVWEKGRLVDPVDTDEGKLEGFISDITAQKALQEHLRRSKDRYKSLFNSIQDAILVADPDRRVINCNPAFTELFGYELDEIKGKPTSYLYASEDEYERIGESLNSMKGESRTIQTMTFKKRSGKTFPGETTAFALKNPEGDTVGKIGIIRDISNRRTRLKQLQIVDRVLQHNFHNEMNLILGFADTIRDETEQPTSEYADRISQAGNRLLETVSKEREITKFLSESPPKKNLDMGSICNHIVERIHSSYPRASITLHCDEAGEAYASIEIGRAIEELITNCVIHAEEDSPSITLSAIPEDGRLSVIVEDNNPQIPSMEREVLKGEETPNALRHGSGMGLWLVSLIVEESDGVVEFEQKEPRGNIVTIRLPQAR